VLVVLAGQAIEAQRLVDVRLGVPCDIIGPYMPPVLMSFE